MEWNGGRRTHPVEVALLRAHLDREAARVPRRVRAAALAADGGEADGKGRLLADLSEERGAGQVGDVMGSLEVTVSTRALGVHLEEESTTVLGVRSSEGHLQHAQECAPWQSERGSRSG